jgi:multiple sugar transport system substrate-binding protein
LRDAGVFVDNVEGLNAMDMEQAFFTDKAAMMSSGSWVMTHVPDTVAEHVTLGGLPIMPGSPYDKPTTWSDTGGLAFCVTRNGAKNLDAVKKFVQFFYTEPHMASLVEAASITPPFPVTVDESKLGPIFKQSLTLSDKYQTFLFTDPMFPPSVARGIDMAAAQAFQPGTSVDAILQALDDAYKNK